MNNHETSDTLDSIIDYVTNNDLRSIMVLSHDAKFAIAKDGGLIHRDSADMKWFRRLTSGHACVVGRRTYPEVKALPNRIWVQLTTLCPKEPCHWSDKLSHGITFARQIALSKGMSKTVVIAGGSVVYNNALDGNYPDAIIATVWDEDLKGDKFVNDYTADGRYRLFMSVPLDVVGDVGATVKLFIKVE